MTPLGTRILRATLLALLAACLTFSAGGANTQVSPTWDHYHVYKVTPHPFSGMHVQMLDQFGGTTHQVLSMSYFANPVTKIHAAQSYPVNHPQLHYDWWVLDPLLPFNQDVIATNQFGEQTLHLFELDYLLTPSLLNPAGPQPLPFENHYKVYACTGPGVNVPVTLIDQFMNRPAMVAFPRYFCVPADKRVLESGQYFPMVNGAQHYTVYEIDPQPTGFGGTVLDQFLLPPQTLTFNQSLMLMVPTDKALPTPTKAQTWGRLKALYR